jgi:hypothetical protein
MPARRRGSSVVATGSTQDLEGGNRKGARKRVVHTTPKADSIQEARIQVGATRAPQLVPEGDSQSQLGQLFDQLGDFAKGPFAQALQDKHFSEIEERAEQAVFEGTSLDDIEDKNFVFQHYYNGANGRKVGVAAVRALEEDIASQADDDTYDVDAAATRILSELIPQDMDPTAATNAAKVVRKHLPVLLDAEKARRTKKVRIETLLNAQEVTAEEGDILLGKEDYVGFMNLNEGARADAKNAEGIFDSKAYAQNVATNIAASLKNPALNMTPEQIADFQKVVETYKAPNGSSMWNSPDTGPYLKKAFASAVTTKTQGRTLDDAIVNGQMLANASDIDTIPTKEEIEARVNPDANGVSRMSATKGATVYLTGEKTRARDAEVRTMMTEVVGESATASDLSWLNTPKDVHDSSRMLVDQLEEDGSSPDEARLVVARVFGMKGHEVPWIEAEYEGAMQAGDYEKAYSYLEHQRAITSSLGMGFGDVEDRAVLDYYKRTVGQNGEEATKANINMARENFTKNRGMFTKRDFLPLLEPAFRTALIKDAASQNYVLNAAAMLMGTGSVTRQQAVAEAIRLYEAEVSIDEHGVPMLPGQRVIGWEKEEVRQAVRTHPKFIEHLNRNVGIKTGKTLGFFDGNEDKVRIVPLSSGQGMLLSPKGRNLGLIPLKEWVGDVVQAENDAVVEADAKAKAKAEQDRIDLDQHLLDLHHDKGPQFR